jgi:ribosomal protein S18 acetylase RimI-like enzyme
MRDAPAAVTIRAARMDEADPVADVYLASRRRAGASIPRGTHTDDDVRLWFASIVLVTHETWVAEQAGRIVALLVLRGESLDQLYVHPEQQRHGIGSALLAHAKRRRRRLRLYTFESNEPARAFYEKHGFRAIAFGDGTANDEGAPDILYEWTAR